MVFRFPLFGCCAIVLAGPVVVLFSANPLHCQVQSGWVISAIHPDPTPAMGAPEVEYIALYARGFVAPCASTEGLKLSWNGHERLLPDSCWANGSTLLVHRAADSAHFELADFPKVAFSTWPALVNGGTTVYLLDSLGQALDAMSYAEGSLDGGGRPLLRKDPWACGGGENQALWAPPLSPFHAVGESEVGEGLHMSSQSLLSVSADFDRWIPRGRGHWEWRLAGSVDPALAKSARMTIGGVNVALDWPSDSVVVARWPGRLEALSVGEDNASDGVPVVLGPLRSCARHAASVWLKQTLWHLPQRGEVEPIELLADPQGLVTDGDQEHVILVNKSPHLVDAGGWDWSGGSLRRRRLLWPNQPIKLKASDFDHWPGLTNSGGSLNVLSSLGSEVAALSWSTCDHQSKSEVGRGLPLVREARRLAGWNTKGTVEKSPPLQVRGFGCQRDWTGAVHGIEVHLDRPVSFLPPLDWSLTMGTGEEPVEVDFNHTFKHPETLTLSVNGVAATRLEWPSEVTLTGRKAEDAEVVVVIPRLSCPAPPLASLPACLRVDEVLWNAKASGEEFVEVLNCGEGPVDLSGLSGSVVANPAPAEWDEWVDVNRSVVLLPGHVMAFGECPKWFASDHDNAGEALWPVEHWSALNDGGGQLHLGFPSRGTDSIDVIQWTSEMEGPWWWSSDGWSWVRKHAGSAGWAPSKDKGSPGRPQFIGLADCEGANAPVIATGTEDGTLPSVQWDFPSPGHQIEVRIVGWPDGTLQGFERLGMDLAQGNWSWQGHDLSGQPALPRSYILDVRWTGPVCRGRQSIRARVPGFGN